MPRTKSILVATIGTRDLAYLDSENTWLSVGNDRSPDMDSITQQTRVQYDLGIEENDFRSITKYLLDDWEKYQERLQPIILGKLIQDEYRNLGKIYLIGTNQPESTPKKFREKDTIFSSQIIKKWIENKYKIETIIIEQCTKGENPSNFDQMFAWYKDFWQSLDIKLGTSLLLCLKGGVGQSSEAARITALSKFEDDCIFYDFIENEITNQQGKPSSYTQVSGGNYLWDRRQKEALQLLENWDYQAVFKILNPYFRNNDDPEILRLKKYLEMAIQWNMTDFQAFANNLNSEEKSRANQWWWSAYESAYLAVIRFQQGNTTDAMFHSFRAVEGLISEWAIYHYKPHIIKPKNQSPALKNTVFEDNNFSELYNKKSFFAGKSELKLYGSKLDELLQIAKPEIQRNSHWRCFFDTTRDWRNQIFHRLLKLEKQEVFTAWDTNNRKEWELRILGCINILSGQTFLSLESASFMSKIHQNIKQIIESYSLN